MNLMCKSRLIVDKMIKKSQKLLTYELTIQYFIYKHEIFLKTYNHFKLRNVSQV